MQRGWKTIIRQRPTKDKISNKHLFLAYVQSRLNHLNKLYIHCRKIYNLFVRTLETCRKRGFGLFCNRQYVFTDNMYIVFILQYQTVKNNCQIG